MPTTIAPERLVESEVVGTVIHTDQVNQFTLTLASSEWETNVGVAVALTLFRSDDAGQSWSLLGAFTPVSRPLVPPDDAMPMLAVTLGGGKQSPRLRLHVSVSAPIRLGATLSYT